MALMRGDSAISNPTSTRGRSSFYYQIHYLGRNDQASSLFGEVTPLSGIQLLLGEDQTFTIRSTVLVGAIEHLRRLERGDSAVDDPTFTRGRSGLCCQIHRPGRSDRAPSLFREVTLLSAIQLLLGGRSGFCCQIHRPSRSDRTPSSFGEIQCPGRSDRANLSFGEVALPSAIQLLLGDDRAFAVKSTILVGAIGHLHRLKRIIEHLSSDPCYGRSNQVLSSFGEEEVELHIVVIFREVEAKLHDHHLLREVEAELHHSHYFGELEAEMYYHHHARSYNILEMNDPFNGRYWR
ncbi:hypothetical protein E5676_scaffold124G00090 [Cucumis melo var. makuwa]|uniref:Uncharacterized protein n=1 Tax=Cucumis melo var. makuwa TaxID=1194695 RepID=A0A5D3DTT9_CUCMM|nr:hypothetical protein E6C27_scaffold67G006410 [Cucumis melo var. makuwa]TYK26725.1 hypothetical protein E5676_scaffold124G00090 [Cucumis melo var. makuwa]